MTSATVQLIFNFLTLKMYAGLTIDGEVRRTYEVQYVPALGNQTDWQTLTNSNVSFYEAFVAKVDASGGLVWALAGGGNEGDEPGGIALDSQGNCYVAAAYWGPWQFAQLTLPANGPGYNASIFKIDSGGILQWAYGIGASAGTIANVINVDLSDKTYVAGRFDGTISFGQTNLVSRGLF